MNHWKALIVLLAILFHVSAQGWNLSKDGLQDKLNNPSVWAVKEIERDFHTFQDGFSPADISHCIENLKQMQGIEAAGMALLSIENGQIAAQPLFPLSTDQNSCLHGFLSALNALNDLLPLPSVSFLMTFNPSFDRPLLVKETNVPVFAISKERGNRKVVLIPRLWNMQRETSAELYCDWDQKIEKALFRGATTDGPYGYFDWDFRPRARLALRSRFHRSLIDAALLPASTLNNYINNWMSGLGVFASYMPPQKQIAFKYLIAMDGRSSPSSLEWQLFSGSLVLKSRSSKLEWFYAGLIPDFHYFEFRPDGDDIVDRILWLKSHDSEAKEIAENGRAFALENLRDESAFSYLYLVLQKYSELYSFSFHKRTEEAKSAPR